MGLPRRQHVGANTWVSAHKLECHRGKCGAAGGWEVKLCVPVYDITQYLCKFLEYVPKIISVSKGPGPEPVIPKFTIGGTDRVSEIYRRRSVFLQGGEGVITLEPCRGHSQKPGGVCLQFSSRVAQKLHFSVGNLPKKIFSAQVKKMLSTWVFRPGKGSHRIFRPRILASEHDKWTWEDFSWGSFGDHGAVPNYTVKLVQFREGLRLNSSYALGSPAQHEMSYLLVLNNKYTTTKFQWWFAEKG